MYEIELRDFIRTATGSAAVHWQVAPDHADYPMILLHPVSAVIEYNQDGIDEDNVAIVQVDVWADDIDDAVSLKNSVMNGLADFEPTESIGGIFINNIRAGIDTTTEIKLYRHSIDLRVIGRLS